MLSDRCTLLVLWAAHPNSPGHTCYRRGGPSSSVSKTTDLENIWWSHSSEFQYFISVAGGTEKITPTTTREHMWGCGEVGDKRKTPRVKVKRKLLLICSFQSNRLAELTDLLTAALWNQQKAEEQHGGVNYESHSYWLHYLFRGKSKLYSVVEQFKYPHYGIR